MLKESKAGLIPTETVRIAKRAFPNGNLAMYLRDEFDGIYTDEAFSDLYPSKGQPAETPWRLAMVTILQFSENLSDRQAAEAVRSRIDWKYTLGLPLEDAGFDYTVLCKFRKRLMAGNAEKRLLDALLEKCQEKRLIKQRGCARTDSTHVLAKIKALGRIGDMFEAIRTVLEQLTLIVPEWLKSWVPQAWYERYAHRYESFRLPSGKEKIADFALQLGEDGFLLLDKIITEKYSLREAVPAVGVLREMWPQQYRMERGKIRWKDPEELPPTSDMIASPYDPEARLGSKRQTYWIGYKMHISETCDDDTVHLITHVETALPNRRDNMQMDAIHNGLNEKDLLPAIHFVDAGYMDAGILVESQKLGIQICGPALLNNQWQSRTPGAYGTEAFQIDWEGKTVVCPNGKTSTSWKETQDRYNNPMIRALFSIKDCTPCKDRALCTKAKTQPRVLAFKNQAEYEALNQARQSQGTKEWKALYKKRAGIEGTISQGVRAFGLRKSRYIGFAKTHFQHIATAAAVNIVRLHAWSQDVPRSKTRQSCFSTLVS